MSARATVTIRCDWCGSEFDVGGSASDVVVRAREAVKRSGWMYSDGSDYCSSCATGDKVVRAVASVLADAGNYPDAVIPHLLGLDLTDLIGKTADAVVLVLEEEA